MTLIIRGIVIVIIVVTITDCIGYWILKRDPSRLNLAFLIGFIIITIIPIAINFYVHMPHQ